MDRTSKRTRPGVSVSVLPDFELCCGDRRVVAVPTAERLIAFLALHAGRRLRRPFVSGMLWHDSPQHRANACLRSAVWRAPLCGGRPVVEASNSHVWLHPDVAVDLCRANDLTRRLLHAGEIDLGTIDLRRDLALLGDDVLVGWYDDWAVVERERFRVLRLQALEQLADELLNDGCARHALQVAVTVAAAEPLRESAQRLLVRCHLRDGNLAEALRQYASYADLLQRELGVRPSRDMVDLVAGATGGAAPRRYGRGRGY